MHKYNANISVGVELYLDNVFTLWKLGKWTACITIFYLDSHKFATSCYNCV